MTISNEIYRHDYAGNDSTVLFAISFYFLADTHIKVLLYNSVTYVETELTLNTHYTLTGTGDMNGGELTMITAPTLDESLTILRSIDVKQLTDYVEGGSFPAEDHEEALDKLTMLIQQLKEETERGLRLAESQAGSWTLPAPIAEYFLRYNAAADAFETVNIADLSLYTVSAFAETLLDDLTASAFLTTLGFSTFVKTLLNDADAEEFRDTLGVIARKNILLNQDFLAWQDSISFVNPTDGNYTADGYLITSAVGGGVLPTINVKKNTDVQEAVFEQCCELEITNVGTSGATRRWAIYQRVEDYKKYRGKTITLSVRVKASTAVELSAGNILIWDGVSYSEISVTSITTSWVTYSTTYTVNAAATTLEVRLQLIPSGTGTIDTAGSIYIQWMKLEEGSNNTLLVPRSNAEEYLLCGTVIAPLNRTNPSVRFEDDAGNLGVELVDGGKIKLANGTEINEFSIDGTLAGNSDDAVSTEKAFKTYIDTRLPVGAELMWSKSTPPTGWHEQDGAEYSMTTYENLYDHLGNDFGMDTGNTVTFTNATNLVNRVAHGLSDNTVIEFTNSAGALPTGLVVDTKYFIINALTDSYQVSLTLGGAAVTFSDDGSGTNTEHTKLKVPDMRGEFARGWDNTAGNDPDAASRTDRGDGETGDKTGTKQSYQIQSHVHPGKHLTDVEVVGGSATAADNQSGSDWNIGPTGGSETRGRNVNKMFIIKY